MYPSASRMAARPATVSPSDIPTSWSRHCSTRRRRRVEQCRDQLVGMSLGDTVAGLAAILDAEGYMADVDKLPGDSYRLTLHSCAIWAVASHYGLACTTELEFMQEVVPEAEVTRIVHKVAGAYVCAYEIRPRGTTPPTSHPKARRDLTSA